MSPSVCVVCHQPIEAGASRVTMAAPGHPDVLVDYHTACWAWGHPAPVSVECLVVEGGEEDSDA